MSVWSCRVIPMIAAGLFAGLVAGAASAQVILGEIPMPVPQVEVVPAVPGVGWAWVPGHWSWDGAWVWIPGHYYQGQVAAMPAPIVEVVPARPAPNYVWVRGHYVWTNGHWVWRKGIWAPGRV